MLSISAGGAPGKNVTISTGALDPLYKARRMLHTRSCLLTLRQQHPILDLFTSEEHVALEGIWSVYQNITWRLPRSE